MRIICPECHFSRDVPDDKVPTKAALATCPKCGVKFRFRDPEAAGPDAAPAETAASPEAAPRSDPASPAAPTPPPLPDEDIWSRLESMRPGPAPEDVPPDGLSDESPADMDQVTVEVPFERLDKYGFFQGVWQTVRRAVLSPGLFFRTMPLKGIMGPLVFYILLFQCSMVLEAMWSMVGVPPLSAFSPVLAPLDPVTAADVNAMTLFVFFPAMAGMMAFLSSGVVHALLMLFRAGDRGYEATFRAMAYSNATLLLSVIPYGYLPGMLWGLVVFLIGLKNLHRSSWLRLGLAFAIMVAAELLLAVIVVSQGPPAGGLPS